MNSIGRSVIRFVKTVLFVVFAFWLLLIPSDSGSAGKPKLDVIVLDAGHGGKDAGAIGTNGYMEKQATLGIVLKLGKLIEKELPGTKVVYTRHDDTFIELDKRGQIANKHHGKLFISIHCN